MRIAIISDTHLGYARFEEDSLKQAESAFLDAEQKADAIIFAGDVFDTKIPKLDGENKIVKGEFAGKLKLSKKPVMSTFAKVGSTVILDPDMEEEAAASARFSVGVADDDTISAFQKGGSGSFTVEEVNHCIETAFKNAKHIRKVL